MADLFYLTHMKTMEVVKRLISLGALEEPPPKVRDNTKAIEAQRRRSALRKIAKELGQDPPEFRRGRPKTHFTEEERRLSYHVHKQTYKRKVKELIHQGLGNLVNQGRSTDSNNDPTTNKSQPC